MSFTEKLIQFRLESSIKELETTLRGDRTIRESLPLGLGNTSIDREVLADGSRGKITISSDEFNEDGKYTVQDGKIVRDFRYYEQEDISEIGPFRRAIILSRIAFGRINHWEAEVWFNDDFDE